MAVRRALFVLAAMALARCGSGPAEADRDWTEVKEKTACEVMVPAYCVGVYGFTVQNGGAFTVGPAFDGAAVRGALTDSEREQLSSYAAAVNAHLDEARECDGTFNIPGSADRLDLVSSRHGVVRVFEAGTRQNCYVGGRSRVILLHDYVKGLMLRYYPRPFPPV